MTIDFKIPIKSQFLGLANKDQTLYNQRTYPTGARSKVLILSQASKPLHYYDTFHPVNELIFFHIQYGQEGEEYLEFEVISFVPFEPRLIDFEMFTRKQVRGLSLF